MQKIRETGVHISKIDTSLLEYEKDIENFDLLNQVFRSAHTIKGSARILQLSYISDVAHKLEDVLDALRNKKIPPSKEMFSSFFRTVDAISEMVERTIAQVRQALSPTLAATKNSLLSS